MTQPPGGFRPETLVAVDAVGRALAVAQGRAAVDVADELFHD